MFNADKFPELPTALGTLLQIVAIDSGTAVRDFQSTTKSAHPDVSQAPSLGNPSKDDDNRALPERGRRGSMTITIDEKGSKIPGGRDIDVDKTYVFAVSTLPADLKSKHANLQVRQLQRSRNYATTQRKAHLG